MSNDDIVNAATAQPRGRSRWPLALLVLALLAAGALLAVWAAVDTMEVMPVNIVIDGEEVISGIDLASLDPGQQIVLAAALLFALLVVLVVVPVALLMALAAVLLILLLAFGLPLLAALAALALVLSPLALLVWLVWRIVRPSPTMPG